MYAPKLRRPSLLSYLAHRDLNPPDDRMTLHLTPKQGSRNSSRRLVLTSVGDLVPPVSFKKTVFPRVST